MCGKVLWEKTLVFGLTFAVGVFLVSALSSAQFRVPDVPQPESFEPRPLSEQPVLCTRKSTPICKKYRSDASFEKTASLTKLNELKLKLENKQLSRRERLEITKKIDKLETEIDSQERKLPTQKFEMKESKPIHNLLYIENCEQY